jgi:hypothetical protein
VVTHHNYSKIEEILEERDPKAFMKHFRSVLERFEIPHECKIDILLYFFFSDRH